MEASRREARIQKLELKRSVKPYSCVPLSKKKSIDKIHILALGVDFTSLLANLKIDFLKKKMRGPKYFGAQGWGKQQTESVKWKTESGKWNIRSIRKSINFKDQI